MPNGRGGYFAPVGLVVDSSGDAYLAGAGEVGTPLSPNGTISVIKLNSSGSGIIYAANFGAGGFSGLAVDPAGDAYVTGTTSADDFPLKNPLQSILGSTQNAFVTEINPAGNAFVFSTYLGETSAATGTGIAVDPSGNAYVVGYAAAGFPVVNAFQSTCSGGCPFISKIVSGGSALAYSTFLGSEADGPVVTVVDSSGNVYVTGSTLSASFPLLNPIQSTFTQTQAAFVAELNAAGALQFSTYLGDGSTPTGLFLDSSNNIYVTGALGSYDSFPFGSFGEIPVVDPILATTSCVWDAACGFVSELSPGGGALVFSSYLFVSPLNLDNPVGGPIPQAVAVDGSGNIYLAGGVTSGENSQSFAVFNAFQPLPASTFGKLQDAFIVKISPSAGAAAALTPSLWQFGLQQVGISSGPAPIGVYNLGTDPLTVSNASTTGDFAVVQNGCSTVGISGASCTVNVTFTPTATGTRNGSVIITDSSPGSPHTVALVGQGGEPTVSVNPTSLTFGNQAVGSTSAYQTVGLSSTGGFDIPINRVDITGDFAETQLNCGVVLNNDGAACQIRVTFTPTATGTRTGTLTVTDGGVGSPQIIPLTGNGVPPGIGLGVASGGSSSATVAPGTTAKYSLSIGGLGMSGTASLSCSGAPTGATCTVPATESVNSTTAAGFDVTVTTTAATAGTLRPVVSRRSLPLWAVFLVGWIALPLAGRRNRALKRSLFLSLVFGLLCSCGGGSSGTSTSPGNGGTPAGSYTLTVTAKIGSTSQSLPLKLTVQ